MSLSLHGAEPLGTWAQWRKISVNRIPPTCVVSYLRGSKNYTPIQLPLSSPPSSPGQTAMRMSPFTQGLNFRPAGNLLYRLLCSNEMFVSWQESPVELHYLKWQSVCYFYDCTIFARKHDTNTIALCMRLPNPPQWRPGIVVDTSHSLHTACRDQQ